jgi:hypothetical protein
MPTVTGEGHLPGQVLGDLAVVIADSGDALAHLATLRDQDKLFGVVASDATAWRVVDRVDEAHLDRPRAVRDAARERAWAAGAGPDLSTSGADDRPGRDDHDQLSFTDADRHRFTTFLTDTAGGQLADLEVRHRAHARVEDRIRTGKATGLRNLPCRDYPQNKVWLELSLAAADLLTWTQAICLTGELSRCEPAALRYRLLHVAARITRTGRTGTCAWTGTGPGPTTWPPPSPDSAPHPGPPERHPRPHNPGPGARRRPTAGHPACTQTPTASHRHNEDQPASTP